MVSLPAVGLSNRRWTYPEAACGELASEHGHPKMTERSAVVPPACRCRAEAHDFSFSRGVPMRRLYQNTLAPNLQSEFSGQRSVVLGVLCFPALRLHALAVQPTFRTPCVWDLRGEKFFPAPLDANLLNTTYPFPRSKKIPRKMHFVRQNTMFVAGAPLTLQNTGVNTGKMYGPKPSFFPRVLLQHFTRPFTLFIAKKSAHPARARSATCSFALLNAAKRTITIAAANSKGEFCDSRRQCCAVPRFNEADGGSNCVATLTILVI